MDEPFALKMTSKFAWTKQLFLLVSSTIFTDEPLHHEEKDFGQSIHGTSPDFLPYCIPHVFFYVILYTSCPL